VVTANRWLTIMEGKMRLFKQAPNYHDAIVGYAAQLAQDNAASAQREANEYVRGVALRHLAENPVVIDGVRYVGADDLLALLEPTPPRPLTP
jgi:hypothetical protein